MNKANLALLSILVMAVTAATALADQACNTSTTGTVPGGSGGLGAGGTSGAAFEAAWKDLTGYTSACAKCDPEGEERCLQEYGVYFGASDGGVSWFPIHTIGAPTWGCHITCGSSDCDWSSDCGDC